MLRAVAGRCKAQVFDADGLGDAPFLTAMREKRLGEFLKTLKPAMHAGGVAPMRAEADNLVLDMFVAELLWRIFPGAPGLPAEWNQGGTTVQAILASIVLADTVTEPTYQENSSAYYRSFAGDPDNVNSTYAAKRFLEDDSEGHQIYVNPSGRESIIIKSRFLWLPSQGDLTNINSVLVEWCADGDRTSDWYRGRVCRVRLKNGTTPTTLAKSLSQSLLIEYEHEFVSN